MKLLLNVASLPVTASSTIDDPTVSKDEVAGVDTTTFHCCPFHVQAGASIGNTGQLGRAPGVAPACIGQAIAGCAAPRAGAANGPRVRSIARPATGSVARVPPPKTTYGVGAEVLDQSLPFHNHVAADGAT